MGSTDCALTHRLGPPIGSTSGHDDKLRHWSMAGHVSWLLPFGNRLVCDGRMPCINIGKARVNGKAVRSNQSGKTFTSHGRSY